MSEHENTQQEPSMEEILASIRRIISEDNDDTGAAAAQAPDTSSRSPEAPSEPQPVMYQQQDNQPEAHQPYTNGSGHHGLNGSNGQANGSADVLELNEVAPDEARHGGYDEPRRQPEPQDFVQPAYQPQEPQQPQHRPVQDTPSYQPQPDTSAYEPPQAPARPEPVRQPEPSYAAERREEPRERDLMVVGNQSGEERSLVSDEAMSAAVSAFDALDRDMNISDRGPSRSLEAMVEDMIRPMLKEWLEENLPAIVEEVVEAEVRRVSQRRGRRR